MKKKRNILSRNGSVNVESFKFLTFWHEKIGNYACTAVVTLVNSNPVCTCQKTISSHPKSTSGLFSFQGITWYFQFGALKEFCGKPKVLCQIEFGPKRTNPCHIVPLIFKRFMKRYWSLICM